MNRKVTDKAGVEAMWSDVETRQDFLNYSELAEVVASLLSDPNMLPLSIGVSGGWGTGKSSMLNLIEARLPADTPGTRFIVVRFDAWLYQGYDDARASLMEAIASKLVSEAKAKDASLVGRAKSLLKRVDKIRALGLIGEAAAAMAGFPAFGFISKGANAISRIVQGQSDDDDISGVKEAGEQAKSRLEGLIKPENEITPPQQIEAFREEFGALLSDLKATLVVFIDNLDRCLPPQTIHTLEALRLFLFMSNTAFCVAADEDMIRHSVSKHFGDDTMDRLVTDYLDKLIQIPIRVPRLGVQEVRSYLFLLFASAHEDVREDKLAVLRKNLENNLRQAWTAEPLSVRQALESLSVPPPDGLAATFDMADRMAPLLANSSAVSGNPRIIKRLLNTVRIRTRLARIRQIAVEETAVAKIALFERCMGEAASIQLYSMIQAADDGKPEALNKLQQAETPEAFTAACPIEWATIDRSRFLQEWVKMEPLLGDTDLRPMLHLSRDTVALVGRRRGLSEVATEALKILGEARLASSPAALRAIERIPLSERRDVMDALISNMRSHINWNTRPPGWQGATALANIDRESALVLRKFVAASAVSPQPAWLRVALAAGSPLGSGGAA